MHPATPHAQQRSPHHLGDCQSQYSALAFLRVAVLEPCADVLPYIAHYQLASLSPSARFMVREVLPKSEAQSFRGRAPFDIAVS